MAQEAFFQFFAQYFHEPRLLNFVIAVPDHCAVHLAKVSDLVVESISCDYPYRLGAVNFVAIPAVLIFTYNYP